MWWARDTAAASSSTTESRDKAEGPIPFAALIAFTCILFLSPQNSFPALKPLRIAFLAAGLAAASLLWERWRDGKGVGFNREILICFALLAWAFMTIPLSFWPGGSVARLTDVYIKSVIVFWLLANVITTLRRLHLMRIGLILCSVLLAVTALKNFVSGAFIQDTEVVARITGYDGALSANPNDLALVLNLLLPLSIALFLSAKSNLGRLLSVIVIVMNVLGVMVTFSRAGFLGLATIAAVYFLQMIRRRGADRAWAFMILFVAGLAVPFLPSNYVERLSTVTSVASDPTGSAQARWRDSLAAVRLVMEHPIIGAGIGMDIFALNQIRGEEWVQVHNVYLEYAVDLGVPGGTLFLLLLHGVHKGVRSSRKRLTHLPEHRELFLLVQALETSVVVFAICGFFHPVAYHFYFYYIGGLALGARAVTQRTLSFASA
jgi:O-antigen ligase